MYNKNVPFEILLRIRKINNCYVYGCWHINITSDGGFNIDMLNGRSKNDLDIDSYAWVQRGAWDGALIKLVPSTLKVASTKVHGFERRKGPHKRLPTRMEL